MVKVEGQQRHSKLWGGAGSTTGAPPTLREPPHQQASMAVGVLKLGLMVQPSDLG